VKGAKVSEYGGKSLNAGDEHSQIFLDPPGDKRCDELRKWYQSASPETVRGGLSMTASRDNEGQEKSSRPDNFKLIREMIDAVQADQSLQQPAWNSYGQSVQQKSKLYMISGFIQSIKNDDKMIYNSCPVCRKKVQDEPAGYRCEQCDKVHSTMVPTYMLTAKVSDLSGQIYMQFPRELGDAIMGGKTAKDFQEFKERTTDD